jgi:regulator of CtrA degradation
MTGPSERGESRVAPFVSFGERMMASDGFRTLFREGMSLVEETAAYLDGEGRKASRNLTRPVALAYATESMRLTTRLMQLASWLLIQRAVNEGEMSAGQALEEKSKVRLAGNRPMLSPETFTALPDTLRHLIGRSERLQERVQMLERQLTRAEEPFRMEDLNPVAHQLALIRTAFEVGTH